MQKSRQETRAQRLHVRQKAVEMVAKSWGTSLWQGKTPACPPTPENPQGLPYITEATGYRAELIMKGYEPEIHKKWLQKRKECQKLKPQPKY